VASRLSPQREAELTPYLPHHEVSAILVGISSACVVLFLLPTSVLMFRLGAWMAGIVGLATAVLGVVFLWDFTRRGCWGVWGRRRRFEIAEQRWEFMKDLDRRLAQTKGRE
jgi:hypothetical protein